MVNFTVGVLIDILESWLIAIAVSDDSLNWIFWPKSTKHIFVQSRPIETQTIGTSVDPKPGEPRHGRGKSWGKPG